MLLFFSFCVLLSSRPAWGAWIEISVSGARLLGLASRPAWGAWIEIDRQGIYPDLFGSRPAWGAWIEITALRSVYRMPYVAPRMGRVD